jgi:hypothetical protein
MLVGQIRPLVKDHKGDLSSPDNYRPIMVSSNFLKIFEYSILTPLNKCIKLDFRQLGFRNKISTTMATALLKETISNYVKKNSSVYCSFLDMSKAFDKINHFTLIDKLYKTNLPVCIIKTIFYMYKNQNVHVQFKNATSDSWKVGNGARQGSIISPLLFNLYINEIITLIASNTNQCKLGINVMNIIAYADDLTLLALTPKDLQILINKLYNMLKNLNLNVNCKKSACMIFKSKTDKKLWEPLFYLNNSVLTNVNTVKYLGVNISNNLTNKQDIIKADKAFLKKFHGIFRKFSFAAQDIKLFLFKSHSLDYFGADLWSNLKDSIGAFKHAAINYHKAIKMILKLPFRSSNHDACDIANSLTFEHFINSKIISFGFQILNSKSPCLYPHLAYLKHNSQFKSEIEFIAYKKYNISNVFENDLDAIKARISRVQNNEPRYIRPEL